ncbi:MAG: glycosyl transferase group 1 [uncultured bacterium]|nr:MAG: glycosyl transferase group 1 [uncultured bacterium]HBR71297.1 hypothetical protein [Candidatus Moranbacteria bacterium]
MRIGINASFARKLNTGIGQVTVNFLRKLAEIQDSKMEFILYLEEDMDLPLPKNFTKNIFLPVYKREDLIRKIWWEKYLLPKKAEKDGCDVFISLYQCPTIFHKKKGFIKHLMIVHDIIPKFFPEYLNNFRKKTYWNLTETAIGKANKIIAISHKTEKDLINHLQIEAGKITVVSVAADEIYSQEVSDSESKRVLEKYNLKKGYIYSGGGLEVRKNTEGTIRAYKKLLDTNTFFNKEIPELVISGKLMPELAPLVTDAQALAQSMGLENKVKFLNFVPQEDLPALYKNSVLFSYPSFYEGFGIPVLEAMHQGVPILTSKNSSLPEVGADTVLYCNPLDINDIAMVMKNILSNEHLRQVLSEKGKKRSANFSWDKFTKKILNIISSIS